MFSKRIIQNIFLLFLSSLLVFFVLEGVFRIVGFAEGIYQFDEKTGMLTLKQNKEFYWIKDCYKNKVRTNSLGFHDFEFNREKPQNIFRIVIVGDSYVEALQVPRAKTFYNLLEHRLNRELNGQRKFEVYSFGRSGSGTFLNYFYLRNYALQYKPDLVINAFLVGNDFRDDSYNLNNKYIQQTGDTVAGQRLYPVFDNDGNFDFETNRKIFFKTNKASKSFIRKIASESAFAKFLYEKYQLAKYKVYKKEKKIIEVAQAEGNNGNTIQDTGKKLDKIPVDEQAYLIQYPEIWQEAWQIEEKLLKEMRDISEQTGSKFFLISLTESFRVHQDIKKKGFDFDKPERLLKGMSEKYQLSYLPLVPVFRERFKKEKKISTFSCDGHWNETGHEWAAEAIFAYLKDHPELIDLR
jgi:hypothetical protein